ncbi:hypothetical protein GGI20_003700 [Coemansia sp. BCRC 34301]|nr:hypothetical protein GGI20_003700 [Coemansia sp. BCRC 34301]
MHVDAHYYSAQALSPTLMPGAAQHHMHVHATPDNRLSLVSLAGHTIANRHSVASLPPRSRRPASIVITHSNPLVAPAASPRYSQAMPSELSAIVQNEELPLGSYAYRRRGSSLLDHSGSSSNSSVASPALPATPKEYNWPISAMPPPPTHSNHAFGHLAYGQSMLHRNNTTKTVSHNDLAGEQHESNHYASATRSATGHIRRHLSPSRSATFATSASSPHAYQRHTYGCQLPARDDSICTLVEHGSSANDEVTMSMHKAARAGDICDDVDVDIPNVGVTGKQFAYLPPRTANFSVTN